MDAHIVGRPVSEDSSLAVRQFVALMRGEMAVQAVVRGRGAVWMYAAERYCLRCCGVRMFDVGLGADGEVVVRVCRSCGLKKEDE